MIVIGRVMAVAMHRPEQIFFEAVRMAMRRDHLRMFLQRLDDPRDMRGTGRDRPNDKGEARKGQKPPTRIAHYRFAKAHVAVCSRLPMPCLRSLVISPRGG